MSGFEPVTTGALRPERDVKGRWVKSVMARAAGGLTCGCSAAGSCSTRPTRHCWYRCCRRSCTCAASNGSRCSCASSARRRANGDQAGTSCSPASWRCCSSKRCGRRRERTRLLACCADWPMRDSRPRYGRCTASPHVRGPWPTREDERAVAFGVLRTLHAHRRPAADGIPARLADGGREGSAAPAGPRACRGGRTRRLRLGEHVQHRVQPARGPASGSLRA